MRPKPEVEPNSFFDLDVRVGRVVAIRPHETARNAAYVVDVDFGLLGVRTTSAQVAHYEAEQLRDRMVVGVVNIGARRIAGVRSEFLMLGSYATDGRVHLLSVDQPGPEPGDMVG
jgi:tRNA-binding protein